MAKKPLFTGFAALAVFGVVSAAPTVTWDWDPVTEYINEQPISQADNLTYRLWCNDTPDEIGPPYEINLPLDGVSVPPSSLDMLEVVRNRPGTYYCNATVRSTLYGEVSEHSTEVSFTVSPAVLDFIPKPLTGLIGTVEAAVISVEPSAYTATHYVAPYVGVANSPTSDEDDFAVSGNGVAFATCVSSGNPCTLMTATEAMSAGDYVQAAPGIYDSIATSILPATFTARFMPKGAGTSDSNRTVLFAKYPGAYYYDQPSLLSELRQTYTGPGGDNPDPIIGSQLDYVTIDGFYIDASVTLPAKNEGAIMAGFDAGNPGVYPIGIEILRNYVDIRDFNVSGGSNSSPLFSHHTYGTRFAGNRIIGNKSDTDDNTGAIQAYWSTDIVIENNYIKGFKGIWIKSQNRDIEPDLINVHIRNNLVVDANRWALMSQSAQSVYIYNNILAGDAAIKLDGRQGGFADAGLLNPIWIYNNTLIGTGNVSAIRVKSERYHNDETEIYNNIVIDATTSGLSVWDAREGPGAGDDIDGMARFNNNVWYKAGSGSTSWEVLDSTKTSFADWQTYAATFGTSPVYTSETYEAASSYSDPEFTSPDYTNVEDGDWTLQNNAQDALSIGVTSGGNPNGVCGAYISGTEEIGLLSDMNGY